MALPDSSAGPTFSDRPGTESSHPVVSSVMTALCHENSGEDIASIVDMQASHMVLLLFVVPRQWPFEGVALVTP